MSRIATNPPYTLLARFYDRVAADAAAMNRHAREKVLGRILPQVRTLCDLGCGTGTTALELARAGKKVYAVDASPGMCRAARAKLRGKRLDVRVLRADMRRLRLPERVDLVLSEFNPLNHLARKSDLLPTFRAVARNLRPGGWFSFDLNTRLTLATDYANALQWLEQPDFCLLMRGRADLRRDKGWLDFDWFLPHGRSWRRIHECVEDTFWADAEIRRALRRAGLRLLRCWDGADVRPPAHRHRRGRDAYYLARKPD